MNRQHSILVVSGLVALLMLCANAVVFLKNPAAFASLVGQTQTQSAATALGDTQNVPSGYTGAQYPMPSVGCGYSWYNNSGNGGGGFTSGSLPSCWWWTEGKGVTTDAAFGGGTQAPGWGSQAPSNPYFYGLYLATVAVTPGSSAVSGIGSESNNAVLGVFSINASANSTGQTIVEKGQESAQLYFLRGTWHSGTPPTGATLGPAPQWSFTQESSGSSVSVQAGQNLTLGWSVMGGEDTYISFNATFSSCNILGCGSNGGANGNHTFHWTFASTATGGGPGFSTGGALTGSATIPAPSTAGSYTYTLTANGPLTAGASVGPGWTISIPVTVTTPLCSSASGGGASGTYPTCSCSTSGYVYNSSTNACTAPLCSSATNGGATGTYPSCTCSTSGYTYNSGNNSCNPPLCSAASGGGASGTYPSCSCNTNLYIYNSSTNSCTAPLCSAASGGGATGTYPSCTCSAGSLYTYNSGNNSCTAPLCSAASGGGASGTYPSCTCNTAGYSYTSGSNACTAPSGTYGLTGPASVVSGSAPTLSYSLQSNTQQIFINSNVQSGVHFAYGPYYGYSYTGTLTGDTQTATENYQIYAYDTAVPSGYYVGPIVTVSVSILCSAASGGGASGTYPSCTCNTAGYNYNSSTNACTAPLCSAASGGGATGTYPSCTCNTSGYTYASSNNSCTAPVVLCSNATNGGASGTYPSCTCNTSGYSYTSSNNSCNPPLCSAASGGGATGTYPSCTCSAGSLYTYSSTNNSCTAPLCSNASNGGASGSYPSCTCNSAGYSYTSSNNSCNPPLCSAASGGGASGTYPTCTCNTSNYIYNSTGNACTAPLCSSASNGGASGTYPSCTCNTSGYTYSSASNSCFAPLCSSATNGGATGSYPSCACNNAGYTYTSSTNTCTAPTGSYNLTGPASVVSGTAPTLSYSLLSITQWAYITSSVTGFISYVLGPYYGSPSTGTFIGDTQTLPTNYQLYVQDATQRGYVGPIKTVTVTYQCSDATPGGATGAWPSCTCNNGNSYASSNNSCNGSYNLTGPTSVVSGTAPTLSYRLAADAQYAYIVSSVTGYGTVVWGVPAGYPETGTFSGDIQTGAVSYQLYPYDGVTYYTNIPAGPLVTVTVTPPCSAATGGGATGTYPSCTCNTSLYTYTSSNNSCNPPLCSAATGGGASGTYPSCVCTNGGTYTSSNNSCTALTASISVSPTSVTEGAGQTSTITATLSATAVSNTSVNFSIGGSAVMGTDYTLAGGAGTVSGSTGFVAIAAGASSGVIKVLTPAASSFSSSTRSVVFKPTAGAGYAVGTAATTTINAPIPTGSYNLLCNGSSACSVTSGTAPTLVYAVKSNTEYTYLYSSALGLGQWFYGPASGGTLTGSLTGDVQTALETYQLYPYDGVTYFAGTGAGPGVTVTIAVLCSDATNGGATGTYPSCTCNTAGYTYTSSSNSCTAPLCSAATGGGAIGTYPSCTCTTSGYLYTSSTNSCSPPACPANCPGSGAPSCTANSGYLYNSSTNTCTLAPISTITASPSTNVTGGPEVVTVANGPANTSDRVLQCSSSLSSAQCLSGSVNYLYVNSNSTTAGVTNISTAALSFTAAPTNGDYYFALVNGSTGSVIATSNTVTLTTPTPVISSFSANPSRISKGGSTRLTWGGTNLVSCAVTTVPAGLSVSYLTNLATGGSATVGPINAATSVTLTCGGVSQNFVITLVPIIIEI